MVNYAYVLRYVRTDEGKRKRKDYELHKSVMVLMSIENWNRDLTEYVNADFCFEG